ncbi:MAG: IclR family transcriptional regulator [Desulfobacterales bacterium]|jgi:DNA-binding IclR family transcriptional regulator
MKNKVSQHQSSSTQEPSGAVKSVYRAIKILEAFNADEGMTVTEISKRFNFPKSSVHQILNTLTSENILKKNSLTNRYFLGVKLFILGDRARANLEIRKVAEPLLKKLKEIFDETVHLTVLDNDEVLYVECFESSKLLRPFQIIGYRAPLHCTAVGKAMMAFLSKPDIDRVIRTKGLKRFTKNTLTDKMSLLKDLEAVVNRGYSVDNIEHEQGVRCIGAPIRNHEGQVFAAVSVTWPSQRLQLTRIPKFAKTVIATANEISQRLGYRMT